MSSDLPDYYFRIRENGAAVFRLDAENRQRRIEMEEIAMVNVRSGTIKPHGAHVLSPGDLAAIAGWLEERRTLLDAREDDEMRRMVDQLNLTTHWAQSRATEPQLEALTEPLLMAMHDLRSVLVRKKSDRLMREAPQD